MIVEKQFEPVATSVPLARRFVLEAVGEVSSPVHAAIAVMISELASNAVVHARTPFDVRVAIDRDSTAGTVRIDVRDSGDGFPEPVVPPPRQERHGRGLFIVKSLADEWGITDARDESGKVVWFRVNFELATKVRPMRDSTSSTGLAC